MGSTGAAAFTRRLTEASIDRYSWFGRSSLGNIVPPPLPRSRSGSRPSFGESFPWLYSTKKTLGENMHVWSWHIQLTSVWQRVNVSWREQDKMGWQRTCVNAPPFCSLNSAGSNDSLGDFAMRAKGQSENWRQNGYFIENKKLLTQYVPYWIKREKMTA